MTNATPQELPIMDWRWRWQAACVDATPELFDWRYVPRNTHNGVWTVRASGVGDISGAGDRAAVPPVDAARPRSRPLRGGLVLAPARAGITALRQTHTPAAMASK